MHVSQEFLILVLDLNIHLDNYQELCAVDELLYQNYYVNGHLGIVKDDSNDAFFGKKLLRFVTV